jgi:hypothetical protein
VASFEYAVITPEIDFPLTDETTESLEGSLNQMGADGWELVSTIMVGSRVSSFFKRQNQEGRE